MECLYCFEVTHPTCVTDYGVEGVIRMDLPNSWECPRCIKTGAIKNLEDENLCHTSSPKIIKTEPGTAFSMSENLANRIPIASGADTDFKGYQVFQQKSFVKLYLNICCFSCFR